MQNILWKIILILAVIALCVYSMYPPSEMIRLGKDLRGGTSLVYLVNIPDDTPDKAGVLNQTITVLKDRVNPKGVLDIAMSPVGVDRIEIVMPLPSDQVRALREKYRVSLETLVEQASLSEAALDDALRAGNAPETFAGSGRDDLLRRLQEAYDAVQTARQKLSEARAAQTTQPAETQPATPDTQPAETQPAAAQTQPESISVLERRVADASDTYEDLRAEALRFSLDEGRMTRILALTTERRPMKDAQGKTVFDQDGDPVLDKAPREVALETLKSELPQLSAQIDQVVADYDTYEANRTTLDDPEDLMRLLRGAGVLEFHIAVEADAPGVNVEELRRDLAEVGPENTDSTQAAWYPINDLKEWYDSPQDLAELEADPQTYFAQRYRLVADRYNGLIHVLLYTTPGQSMVHSPAQEWTVESAGITQDNLGRPAVSFRLDPDGGVYMARLTSANIGKPMAIVLDGQVYSAPNINSRIGSSGIIQGDFSPDDISYLVRVLAAGALSARLSEQPIAINTIGPSLGKDNLVRGLKACLLSLIITAAIMLGYYFFAGIVANVALLLNALIIFGVMAMMQATFTLPGLAGIALSIAMAVDANVLIYERIREELVNNKEDLRTAIRLGYQRALSAIIDGNLTNLIVCVVLFYTATTEVKGFAYTMTIGIVATLFCALFVTRVLYYFYTEYFGFKSLPMMPTVFPGITRALTPSVDWISKRGVFLTIAGIISVGCLALVAMRGSGMLDTEFRGGMTMTMETRLAKADEPRDADDRLLLSRPEVERRVHELGEKAGEANPAVYELRNASVLTVGQLHENFTATRFQIKVSNPPATQGEATITEAVQGAIVDEFREQLNVIPALTFDGANDVETGAFNHAPHRDAIEDRSLGANIGRPQFTQSVAKWLGGVAIVIDNINPPITPEAAMQRIENLALQPDFTDNQGRSREVFGLEPADPSNPEAGFTSLAVVVSDPNLDRRKVDVDLWDSQLAATEWKLIATALARGSSLQEVSSFSPAVARTLAANATVAVVLSLLGMLVYIWVRFGSLRYSLSTLIALAFNVICCLGALAISHHLAGTGFARAILLDEYRIDLNVIAALLTIIGYSLNDTIVILDRIRENRGKRLHASREIINNSINQTFSRTILTGGSTILASVILYVLGGTGIQPFAFTFLVGLIVGTISSVTIAGPLVYKGPTGGETVPATPTRRVGEKPLLAAETPAAA
jgi:SecD/SecF fusion protein